MVNLLHINHWVICILLAAGLTFFVMVIGARLIASATVTRSRFGNLVEAMLDFVREEMVNQFLGEHGTKWFGFIATLFFFVLFSNILGKLPLPSFISGGRPIELASPTANINVTSALAVLVFVIAQFLGIRNLGLLGYCKKRFLLPGAPLWVQPLAILIMPVVLLAEPFSLAVRLFANMTAGHQVILTFALAPLIGGLWLVHHPNTLVHLAAVLPFVVTVVLLAFEFFIAFIQAFVFALLSALYLSESLEEGH